MKPKRLSAFQLFSISLALAFGGCAQLDNYDRSYSLQYGDGKQVISAGVTLHPRTAIAPPAP